MARKRGRSVNQRDVQALTRIQDEVYHLAKRAEKICARIEQTNKAAAETAREMFVRPMEVAAVGGDDAIKAAEETLAGIDIVTKIGDLAR